MRTYTAKPSDIQRKWLVIDADGLVLGRLASHVAKLLRGKHKPLYTPHMDCGDNVIIINAEKVHLTGKKAEQKVYYWHTGHPGGIKDTTAKKLLEGEHPERVIEKAVRRMLKKESPLSREVMRKLYVYGGAEHPHAGQQPEAYDFGAHNPKNKRAA